MKAQNRRRKGDDQDEVIPWYETVDDKPENKELKKKGHPGKGADKEKKDIFNSTISWKGSHTPQGGCHTGRPASTHAQPL